MHGKSFVSELFSGPDGNRFVGLYSSSQILLNDDHPGAILESQVRLEACPPKRL